MKVILDENKKFFKANLHGHSTKSDGRLSVEQIKEEYKKRGYSVFAFTDHEHLIDNSYLNDENFLAITSAELAIKEFPTVSTLRNFNMKVAHFNIYALDPKNTVTPCYSSVYDHYINDEIKDEVKFDEEYERVHTIDGINDLIKKCKEKGFLVSYNHPTWSLENALDYVYYEGLDFVEIYNSECCVNGRPDDEHVLDDILRSGKKIFCTCADDNHNMVDLEHPNNASFGGWVCINADKLDYDTIMKALKNGDFYASTGPEILSLTVDGDKVRVKTSPAKHICLTTRGRRSDVLNAKNGEVNEAEFTIKKEDEFFRITVVDAQGKKAFSQAVKVEF